MSDLTIEEAGALIARAFVFSPEAYEMLPPRSLARQIFEIVHCQSHLTKSLGAVAAVTEAVDHSGVLPDEAVERLQLAACKQVVNALKLAEVVGVSSHEVAEYIQKKYGAT
jgi:hypothetical protein